MKPEVSIILTCYNQGEFIEEAIESVLLQTYKKWELLIFDDGSQDETIAKIKKYIKKNPNLIKLYSHPEHSHKGISETYSLAIRTAKAEFIAFIEGDDRWLKNSLHEKVRVLKKHYDVLLAYTDSKLFGNLHLLPKKLYLHYKFRSKIKNQSFNASKILLKHNIVSTFSSVILRNSFDELNFASPHPLWLDWWLWYQLSLQGNFFFIPQKLTKWRIHKNSANNMFSKNDPNSRQTSNYFKNKLSQF